MTVPVSVRVDFPALDRLTAYLEKRFKWEQESQQAQVDALAEQVTQLTDALHKANAAVSAAAPTV
jgi:hypothetical protein